MHTSFKQIALIRFWHSVFDFCCWRMVSKDDLTTRRQVEMFAAAPCCMAILCCVLLLHLASVGGARQTRQQLRPLGWHCWQCLPYSLVHMSFSLLSQSDGPISKTALAVVETIVILMAGDAFILSFSSLFFVGCWSFADGHGNQEALLPSLAAIHPLKMATTTRGRHG